MRETGPDELRASPHAVLRHDLDPLRFVRAWSSGEAYVVQQRGGWPDLPATAAAMLCVGPLRDLGPLMASVADDLPRAWRTVVEQHAVDLLPVGWRIAEPRAWHWMLRPDPAVADDRVVEVDAADAAAVLALANPGSSALRVRDDVEVRLGLREEGRLLAVGSLARRPSGSGHLTGIATHPGARGRGLAAAVTATLVARAFEGGRGPATLGVHLDNPTAIGLYQRAGFGVAHTFVSGLVS